MQTAFQRNHASTCGGELRQVLTKELSASALEQVRQVLKSKGVQFDNTSGAKHEDPTDAAAAGGEDAADVEKELAAMQEMLMQNLSVGSAAAPSGQGGQSQPDLD